MQMENIKLDTYKLISFDKIPSTQDYAHDLIAHGDATNKIVVVANAQTAGRGRYKRTWVSHAGNLYASFIYKMPERNPQISYAVAVAIAETLLHFGVTPKIKWPNDILVDGKKISGVLIEYAQSFVIVGIGINIESCPNITEYETTKMKQYVNVGVVDVLNVLMKKLDKWLKTDFSIIKNRWMDLATAINETVVYRGNSMQLIGLNEDGALILRKDSRYILIYGDEITI